jgi:hypothetical protein
VEAALPPQDSPIPGVTDTTLLALLWSMPERGTEATEARVKHLVSCRRIRLVGALRGHAHKLLG